MVNYRNAKIYKLFSYQTDKVYYGSSCEKYLSNRLGGHRAIYKRFLNGKSTNYVTSFEIVKYDDCKIELVENYPCDSKEQLLKREGWYITNNDCVNKHIAGRTRKEYREQNKEYYKNYRDKNREHLKKCAKKYYSEKKDYYSRMIDCDCGKIIARSSKAKHLISKKHLKFMETINK